MKKTKEAETEAVEFAEVVQSHLRPRGECLPTNSEQYEVICAIGIIANLMNDKLESIKGNPLEVATLSPSMRMMEALIYGYSHPIHKHIKSLKRIASSDGGEGLGLSEFERQKRALVVVAVLEIAKIEQCSKSRAQTILVEACGNQLSSNQPDNWGRKEPMEQYTDEIAIWRQQFGKEENLSTGSITTAVNAWLNANSGKFAGVS